MRVRPGSPIAAAAAILVLSLLTLAVPARAESGYDLWLRYPPIEDAALRDAYRQAIAAIVVEPGATPTGRIIANELRRGLSVMLGAAPPITETVTVPNTLVVGSLSVSPLLNGLNWREPATRAGLEGFLIRRATLNGHPVTVVASLTEIGALHGAFHFLRLLQTRQPISRLDVLQRPRLQVRMLNHWDNLDGTIERGYAGRSLWNWEELPGRIDPRIADYARANASIGLNGTAINSVNANPKSLTRPYLEKAAAIANVLRPYGIRVYLSANFATPKMLGALPTSDPRDPAVATWWRDKADEIYSLIPDFGGFVVKANSEGQPGPQDYHRTHADGANLLADAVGSRGIVMWRAFVYDAEVDPDRVKRASKEFEPLDGTFRPNVFVQVKNGPLDFMPREPFHPLFGAMPKTPLMAELQITQEYLGHANHLVYLGTMWQEFLGADTYAAGAGSTVAKVIAGDVHAYARTGIAGVANTGSDRNWTGHHFGQANWYAYGRLAWEPTLGAEAIADEWIRMTWGHTPEVIATIRGLMMESREAFVDYTMPLGLHHLIGGDHYAVMPENATAPRPDWTATYYHGADAAAIGYDRTRRGSDAVGQYRSPLREQWNDPKTTPARLLLWFHRLPWDYRLASGRTLWQGLVEHYTRGAQAARAFQSRWETLKGKVDAERYDAVLAKLRIQAADAATWRDTCLRYFQQFSQRPLDLPSSR